MGVGRKLLTPLVAGAAVALSRRGPAGAPRRTPEPYPQERSRGASTGARSAQGSSSPTPPPGQRPDGFDADSPTQIGKAGWKQIVKRAWKETKDDNVSLLAAGVAFYAFLALFPGLIAAVTLYGLVADPEDVQAQVESLSEALPPETAQLIGDQLQSIASGSSGALGIGLVVSLLSALFAASGGVQNLMQAVNLAYDEKETRGFVKLRATALLLTLGAVLFLAVAVGLVAVLPAVLDALRLGGIGTFLVNAARWVGLIAFALVALAVVYRYAPDRDNPRLEWVGLGSIVGTVLWLLGSAAFSLYVSNFGKYGETYGALAGVVVLLLWLFLTSYTILFGAEINAETERQTSKDTTQGPDKPMGDRRAVAADTVATP